MVVFAMWTAIHKVADAVIPIKDVINVQKITRLCALIENALVEQSIVVDRQLLVAMSMVACVPAVCNNQQLSNHYNHQILLYIL